MVDPTGTDATNFALWIDVLAKLLAEEASQFSKGYLSGGLSSVGSSCDPTLPTTSASQDGEGQDVVYQAGTKAGEFVATHDVVVEASVTADVGVSPAITAGLANINGNDNYAFVGGGISKSALPASMTISAGVVEQYHGQGSYSGPFINVTSSAPFGVSVAGNPANPRGPVSFEVTATSDIAGPSQAVLFYKFIGSWTPH